MRLLYVTEDVPNRHPEHGDGSSMIPYEVIRHMADDVEVDLVTFAGPVPVSQALQDRCRTVTVLPKRPPRAAVAKSVASRLSIGAAARVTRRSRGAVRRASAQADVTLVHGPHVAALSLDVHGPVVVQTVDPWSTRLDMEASTAVGLRAAYRRHKRTQAARLEDAFPRRARLLTVGEQDADAWSRRLSRPVRAIANGVELPGSQIGKEPAPTVVFVGSLDYEPNITSARRLVVELAPRIWQSIPTARFVIAGRRPSDAVLALSGPGVDVRPNVPSVADVFRAAHVAVFPDVTGVGVRNSVAEALACGLPVVASSVAARGQAAHDALRVADDPDALAGLAVEALLHSEDGASRTGDLGSRSWTRVAQDYVQECEAARASQAR